MAGEPPQSSSAARDDEFLQSTIRRLDGLPSKARMHEQAYLSGASDPEDRSEPLDPEWVEDIVRRARAEEPPRPRRQAGKVIAAVALMSTLAAWQLTRKQNPLGADPDAARLLAASEPDEADAARLLELARAAEAGEIPRVAKAGKAVLLYGGADPEELESKITFSGYDIYLYAGSVVKDGDVEAARAMLATLDELVSGRSVSLRSDQEAGNQRSGDQEQGAGLHSRWVTAIGELTNVMAVEDLRHHVPTALAPARERLEQFLAEASPGNRR